MTHIDPFAPADSEQHPTNWRPPRKDPHATMELDSQPSGDAMPHWLFLENEPVAQDNPDASIIGQQRWTEYRELLGEFGTEEQQNRMNARTPFTMEQDADMPTLAELRARRDSADAEPPEPADQTGELAEVEPPKTPEDELAAKLKALEAEGL